MDFDQIFLLVLLVAVLGFFIWGRLRYDVVAFAALLIAAAAGIVPLDGAFAGFGHPATVTVAMVLVIGRGFVNSGAVALMARHLVPPIESAPAHVGALASVAGGLSAFMNNVGALAVLMPAALQSAAAVKRSPAAILMPLSFGSILGGLVTLIGTPPNIIVAAFRGNATGTPFDMFDFTPVGGAVAVAGILFIALVGWRLIPSQRRATLSSSDLFQIDTYVSEARVPRESKACGKTLGEIDALAEGHDAVVLGLVRRDQQIGPGRRRETLRAGDVLIFEAAPDSLTNLFKSLGLKPGGRRGKDKPKLLGSPDMSLVEAVVQPRSRAIGRTVEALGLRRRWGVNLAAVSRAGQPFRGRLKSFRFQVGDVLLLEGDADRLPEVVAAIGCLPLAERGLQAPDVANAGVAVGVFAVAIGAATASFVSLPIALAFAAAAMIVLGIVPVREIYDNVDWPVIVLLGAMIPVGQALEATGTTSLIAESLVGLSSGTSPVLALVALLVIAMTLSDVMNNAATAVLMAPIGVEMARTFGVSVDPFLMAVAVGASCAFLTPIGHQNNTLILGPGGYHFGDYWRMGFPLEIIIVVVAVPMILAIWPL
ncbi:MAG TPA: SLC13 family permease [Alphaproteobacteria bacterium]